MVGTLGYAPPEQLAGCVDPTSDLYALVVTLIHLLEGRTPRPFGARLSRGTAISPRLRGFIERLTATLARVETDMTIFYRGLADVSAAPGAPLTLDPILGAYYSPETLDDRDRAAMMGWLERYVSRPREDGVPDETRRAGMNAVNPIYVPRNYLLQVAIERAEAGDRGALAELLDVLRRPYDAQPGRAAFAAPRPEWARNRPGCSMLSCSS